MYVARIWILNDSNTFGQTTTLRIYENNLNMLNVLLINFDV